MALPPDWDSRIGRRLKLRDLHILFTVVAWGSMAKGAAHLHMSQPAVSEAIERLEDALRVRLLDRSPRGVTPTVYGHALLKRGHVAFDELKQGIRDIEFLSDPTRGVICVGCPESLAAGFVPEVIGRLGRRYPNIAVHVAVAQPGEQEFRELRERSADLLIGRVFKPVTDESVDTDSLCQDRFYVAAGARNPWAKRRKIALAELMDEPWILFPRDSVSGGYIERAFGAAGFALPARVTPSFSMQMRFHLLAAGRHLTVLHGSVLRFNAQPWGIKILPVELAIPPMPIAIFTAKDRTLSPVVRLFVDEAHAVAAMKPPFDRQTG